MMGLDFETACDVDLRKHGLDRYVSHDSFRVLLASTHDEDGNTKRIDFLHDSSPLQNLRQTLRETNTIVAHNAPFELAVLDRIGISLDHANMVHHASMVDSAVLARAMGAASKLEAAGPQLTDIDKMEEGRDLIKLFSMPRADGTYLVDEHETWDAETKKKWETFGDYCDVDAEISLMIAKLGMTEMDLNEFTYNNLTQLMNERGWFVDLPLVGEMQQLYLENLAEIEAEFRSKYDHKGELNFRSTQQLRKWCAERKVRATSFDELHVKKLLARVTAEMDRQLNGGEPKRNGPDLEQLRQVQALLQTKQELGGSSLSKLQTIKDMVGTDERLRNQYLHAGAGQTMRTSGRGVQMQNLKRLGPEPDDVTQLFHPEKKHHDEWDNGRLARNLRQVFRAEHPNGQLIVGDFSAVESRGLAYLAGEQWKLDAYRQGRDLYKVLASSMLDVPYDQVDKAGRQQGKVGELSSGYGAGPGAVVTFAEKMGMNIDEAQATEIVTSWREANPAIVRLWSELDRMLHDVVEHRKQRSEIRLPNGNLTLGIQQTENYPSQLREFPGTQNIMLYLRRPGIDLLTRRFVGAHMRGRDVQYLKPREQKSGQLWSARWTKNGQSGPYKLYGGKLTGILTQSFCRQLFFRALLRVEGALDGYSPHALLIGQFHDEAVVEWMPTGGISLDKTIKIVEQAMTDEKLFPDFPLAADVKHGHRYIK